MTPKAIEIAIFNYLNTNWTTTSVDWPNHVFDPPNAAWIRPRVRFEDTVFGEMGDTGTGERSGLLIIQIFVPINTGNLTALSYANNLEVLFRRQSISGVHFYEPTTNDIGFNVLKDTTENKYYQINVLIPFFSFVGE